MLLLWESWGLLSYTFYRILLEWLLHLELSAGVQAVPPRLLLH